MSIKQTETAKSTPLIKLTNMTIVWAEKLTTLKSLYVEILKHIEHLSESPRYITEKLNAGFMRLGSCMP